MKHINTILIVMWTAAFFHAAYHEDIARTVICILIATILNIGVDVAVEVVKPDALGHLVWRTIQVTFNAWLLIPATAGLESAWSCAMFSNWSQ